MTITVPEIRPESPLPADDVTAVTTAIGWYTHSVSPWCHGARVVVLTWLACVLPDLATHNDEREAWLSAMNVLRAFPRMLAGDAAAARELATLLAVDDVVVRAAVRLALALAAIPDVDRDSTTDVDNHVAALASRKVLDVLDAEMGNAAVRCVVAAAREVQARLG